MATRCCCPPESALGSRWAYSLSPDHAQRLVGARPPLLARDDAAQFEREQDVLLRGERRQELEELEDDADMLATPSCELVLAHLAHLAPREDDAPARGPVDASEQVEQCRFAAAGWAVDGEERLRRNGEGEIVQNGDGLCARGDDARDMLNFDQWRAGWRVQFGALRE